MQQAEGDRPRQPPQSQDQQPGLENEMSPRPDSLQEDRKGSGKLLGRTAVITGGDSGIGRAVAFAFAQEGANVVIVYLNEHDDARETRAKVEEMGQSCELFTGDIGSDQFCQEVIRQAVKRFGKIDVLVNNAAEQHPADDILKVTPEILEKTFRTNVFSQFYMVQACLPHMEEGSVIINTTSVTAYRGSPHLVDYSSTKGAIVAFTRSLSLMLAERRIRVNAVAPGPIWTPLIPATFSAEEVESFGSDTPMKRAGQPEEVAGCYVFLASNDSSYMSGQVLHPNGGEIING